MTNLTPADPADIAASDEQRHQRLIKPKGRVRRVLKRQRQLRAMIGALLRNRRIQANRLPHIESNDSTHTALLNVGCGDNLYTGFINLDYKWTPHLDLCWDLRHPLPFPDQSIRGMFAEHSLEHIAFGPFFHKVLPELRRVLKSGGILRIVTNDMEAMTKRYYAAKNSGETEWPAHGIDNEIHKVLGLLTPNMYVNTQFYSYGHSYLYDFDTLALVLSRAGFVNIRRESFMRGRQSELLMDSSRWLLGDTMYIEAAAP